MSTKFIDIPYRWFYRIEDYIVKPGYIWKTLYLWKNNISYFLKCLKWCWQRAFRGWGDCDWWSMDSYLTDIIIPMLKKMKERGIGYPGHGKANTPEKWDSIIDEMIEGFEAARRVIDLDYPDGELRERQETDIKLFEKKMRVFTKWFFALWD